MRAKLVLVRLLAPLAMVILSASVATAQTNTWSLSGVTFDDGTTVAGRLTVTYFHDVDNDSFTTINWNVTVQLGTNPAFTARTYDLGNSRTLFLGILDPVILLEEFPAPPGAGGQRQFRITPAFPLDGTRATVPVVIGVAGTAGSQECFNCTPFRRITAGNFVLVPAVPVMTVPALFGLTGLLLSLGSWAILSRGAGLRRRSRGRTRIGKMSGAFETSFQRLDQLCRRDPACALTSVGVVAAFDEIAARLAAAPVSSPSGAVLTKTALQDIAATLIDFETLWPRGHRRAASTLLRPFLHRRLDSAVYGVAVV